MINFQALTNKNTMSRTCTSYSNLFLATPEGTSRLSQASAISIRRSTTIIFLASSLAATTLMDIIRFGTYIEA